MNIAESVQILARSGEEYYAKVCRVKEYYPENNLVDVEPVDGSADLLDVPLAADTQGGFIQHPKKGSLVVVTFINKHNAVVCSVASPAKIIYRQDGLVFELDSEIGKVCIANSETSLYEVFEKLCFLIDNLKVKTPVGPSEGILPDTKLALTDFETTFKKLLNGT